MNLPFDQPDDPDSFGLSHNSSPVGESFVPSMSLSPEAEASSRSDDSESSDPLLKYISQMLMEENMEDQPHMFHDHFALSSTEKSLYDVIGEQYPSSHDSPQSYVDLTPEPSILASEVIV
uniref:Uncharacterized protein n=1 Tax=Salix viminalis TaxID=40686 RepID=A0A6N2MKZ7_SALVM